jgi:hypothetical protein
MIGSEDRLHQVKELEREIDSLLEERVTLDLALSSPGLRPNFLQRLYLRLKIRALGQRLDHLKLNRNIAYNGYLQLRRDEARRS